MARGLDPKEAHFFSYVQALRLQTVAAGQVGPALGLTPQQEGRLLGKLSRDGRIAKVRRGLYLVPPTLPLGRWSPSEALALTTLMADCGGQYQLCGMNAFNRHGWDEQVPNRLCLYNNRLSGERLVGQLGMTLIKVADSRLGAVEPITTPEGLTLRYPSRARALLDAVYDWSRFGTLPRAYGWIRQEIAADDAMPADLVEAALRYGNQGTRRRIGWLLEAAGIVAPLLGKLERGINRSSGFIPWIPTRPKRGKVNKRWGLILNEQ